MILYHGSYLEIKEPNITFSRNNVDFGRGFYTTPIIGQAKKWAERFEKKKGQSVLNIYEFNETVLQSGISVLEFGSYDEQWLDYIIASRKGNNKDSYDIVIGGVADDKVFDTVELYLEGLIEKEAAIKKLRYEKPNLQVVFRTQGIIEQYVKFIKSEMLANESK